MKALTILSTLIITISSCNCQKKATESALASQIEKTETMTTSQTMPVLVYQSMSRGYFKKIEIQGATVSVQNERDGKPVTGTINKTDLAALETACKAINPKELANLKAPTEKRFYDGAPITNLIMKEGDQSYSTPEFDGGTPPVEIEKVVNLILKIAEKAEK